MELDIGEAETILFGFSPKGRNLWNNSQINRMKKFQKGANIDESHSY